MVDMFLGTILDTYAVEIQSILQTWHPGNEELLTIRSPERNSKILVHCRVKISPHDIRLNEVTSV